MQNKTIDRFNQEKLYLQLTRIFLGEITSGRWQLEKQIPTEEDLCKNYNVSKITVRQAINNLVTEGYLTKIQGKGTFVTCTLPATGGLAMKTRLTEEMFGEEVNVKREILSRGMKEPPQDVKAYLKTEESVYHILSRRMANNEPVYIEEAFIPYHMVPDVEKMDISSNSFYALLQKNALKKIFKIIQTIEVSTIRGDSARDLGAVEGKPALVVHRLLLSSDNTPVAYTRLLGRSDKYKLQTEFERIR